MRCSKHIAGMLLALAVGAGTSTAASADVLPLEAEISIGREAAQVVEEAYPMSDDTLLIARVQRIGRRVAGVCGRPDLPFEFHVVDTPDINAFCLPGGFVYVFRGLLQGVPDDDALAFVIAHEIGHAVKRHSLRQFEKSQLLRIATAPLAGLIGTFGRDMANLVINRRFSRADEAEADREGMAYAVRAGFDSAGAAKAMETLIQLAGRSNLPEFLASHPDTKRRKRDMEALAQQVEKLRPAPSPAPAEQAPEPAWAAAPPASVPTTLFPITIGSQWAYRLAGPYAPGTKATVRVVEAHPSRPEGILRLITSYEGGFSTSAWVTTTDAGILTRPVGERAVAEWQMDWPWMKAAGLQALPRESITVPAGTFQCVRLARAGEDGTLEAEAWLAEGVGLVKAAWHRQGLTQELLSYRIAPKGKRTAVSAR